MNINYENVECLFPPDTKVIDFVGTPEKYTALVRSKCRTKEEFRRDWLKQYEKLSRVALRVLLTRPSAGKIVVYKAAFRCQHNTYPSSHQRVKSPNKKHTGCPAVVRVTIKAPTENRRVRTKDTLRGEYPTVIRINHNHNHLLPTKQLLYESHNYEEPVENTPFLGYEVLMEPSVETELKEDVRGTDEELNWNNLRGRWNALFQKWDLTNSVPLYRALLRTTKCLERFKTVNGTINALNQLGKKVNTGTCNRNFRLQGVSGVRPQLYCGGVNIESDVKLEVCNDVDELLVIDHGWIT